MLSSLASHNKDIEKLLKKGYAIGIDSNYLVVRDIPYLDEHKNLKKGAVISKLVFLDSTQVRPENHVVFFCGSHPCQSNGGAIPNLGGGAATLALTATDISVERTFSNKPPDGYSDHFEKIESYVTLVSGPAMQLYPDATPLTFRSVEESEGSVFKLADTLTSRAEIGDLSAKFRDDIVAIIGLGGTGSYLLDLLVKTPVKEIRCFDLDLFHVHNAFRSPGRLDEKELGNRKTEVYQGRYENFRHGLTFHQKFIQADSTEDLQGITFAFVAVDKGEARAAIVEVLSTLGIPFIDVGMGLARERGPISGAVRSTYVPAGGGQEVINKRWLPLTDADNDDYIVNIQIAELNALNACLAVMKFKQIRGFYLDDSRRAHTVFTLDNFSLNKE
jgi:hypothetical protein